MSSAMHLYDLLFFIKFNSGGPGGVVLWESGVSVLRHTKRGVGAGKEGGGGGVRSKPTGA